MSLATKLIFFSFLVLAVNTVKGQNTCPIRARTIPSKKLMKNKEFKELAEKLAQ